MLLARLAPSAISISAPEAECYPGIGRGSPLSYRPAGTLRFPALLPKIVDAGNREGDKADRLSHDLRRWETIVPAIRLRRRKDNQQGRKQRPSLRVLEQRHPCLAAQFDGTEKAFRPSRGGHLGGEAPLEDRDKFRWIAPQAEGDLPVPVHDHGEDRAHFRGLLVSPDFGQPFVGRDRGGPDRDPSKKTVDL